MKTPAIFRTLSALAAATVIANLTGFATAQVPAPEKPPTVAAAPVDRDAKLPMIDFREARISDVVDFLDKKVGGLNVIVQPKVQNIAVTLKLRNVTAVQVLEAIPFATENRVQIMQLQDDITGIFPSGEERVDDDGRPINRVQCRIFSLMTYLGGKDPKAQEEAIAQIERTLNTAVAMLRQSDPTSNVQIPKMEVNGSAKLLIAVGMPDDLAVVEQLVTALQGSAVPVPAPAGRGAGFFGPAGGRAPSRPGTPGLPGVPGATPGSPGAPVPPPANPNAPGALLPGLEIPAQAQAQ